MEQSSRSANSNVCSKENRGERQRGEPLNCDDCGMLLRDCKDKTRHVLRDHLKLRQHMCSARGCRFSSDSLKAVQRHVSQKHKNDDDETAAAVTTRCHLKEEYAATFRCCFASAASTRSNGGTDSINDERMGKASERRRKRKRKASFDNGEEVDSPSTKQRCRHCCRLVEGDLAKLEQHVEQHHRLHRLLLCPLDHCNYGGNSKEEIRQHIAVTHQARDKKIINTPAITVTHCERFTTTLNYCFDVGEKNSGEEQFDVTQQEKVEVIQLE